MCVGITRHQLTYWHDSEALYTRALAVTQENAVAENNLGVALAQRGKDNEAIKHYREAVRINPDYAQAHYNLGIQLANSGQPGQAAFHFSEALKQNPKSEVLHNNLGVMLARQQKQALAIEQFQQAIFLNPRYPKPYLNYGKVLQTLGQAGPAATNYAKALDLEPESPDALDRLARLFATCPDPQWRRPDGAIKLAKRATELAQNAVPGYLDTLACAYASAGQFSNAMTAAGTARELAIKDNMGSLVEQLDRDLQS
jgi:tetratricopeptide (TPR) repeat protein